jgi:hypothetical protein
MTTATGVKTTKNTAPITTAFTTPEIAAVTLAQPLFRGANAAGKVRANAANTSPARIKYG